MPSAVSSGAHLASTTFISASRSTARGSTKFYTQDIDHAEILTLIEPQIAQYANARNAGERFGDFVIRAEFVTATPAGNRFHENVVLAG